MFYSYVNCQKNKIYSDYLHQVNMNKIYCRLTSNDT